MKKYLVPLLFVLAACNSNLSKLQEINRANLPGTNPFSHELAKEYQILAENELEIGNLNNSEYFVSKGIKAARGLDVEPESFAKAPAAEQNTLQWALGRLVAVKVDAVKRSNPKELAKLQQLYDCWARRVITKQKPAYIEECRMDFILEAAALENRLMPYN